MGKIRNFFAGLWNKASKGALSKGAIIAIAASATVAVAGGVTAGVILNTPEVVAVNAVKGFVEDFFERDEFETVSNMLEKGSMEFSMSELSNNGENVMEDIAVSGKLYFSPKAYMLENLKLESEYLNVNGTIYISDKMFYFREDEIIEEAFGGEYAELADQLRDSIFAPDSGSKFAMPKEAFEPLVNALEQTDNKKMAKDAEKIIKKYIEKLINVITDNAEFESENDEVKVGGEKTPVRVVSITITPETVANVVSDYYDFLANDDDLVKFFEKYEEDFEGIASNIDEDKTMAEIYEDAIEEFEDEVDELVDQMEEIEDDDDSEIVIEIVTPRLSSKLLQLSVKADKEKLFTLDVSKEGIKKSNRISISVEGEKDAILYEIKQNDNKAYKATLEVADNEVVSINVNRAKDKFEIAIGPEGEAVTVSGSIEKNGKTTTIGLKSISYTTQEWVYDDESWSGHYEDVEYEIESDLEIIIKESDKIPAAPKDYTSIDEIEEDDIYGWAEKIEGLVGSKS